MLVSEPFCISRAQRLAPLIAARAPALLPFSLTCDQGSSETKGVASGQLVPGAAVLGVYVALAWHQDKAAW